ncbi:hypothetical protein [Bartonella sp. AS69XJJH]
MVNKKNVYDHVICESRIEKEFAQNLDNDPDIRLFFNCQGVLKLQR